MCMPDQTELHYELVCSAKALQLRLLPAAVAALESSDHVDCSPAGWLGRTVYTKGR